MKSQTIRRILSIIIRTLLIVAPAAVFISPEDKKLSIRDKVLTTWHKVSYLNLQMEAAYRQAAMDSKVAKVYYEIGDSMGNVSNINSHEAWFQNTGKEPRRSRGNG